MRPLAATQEGGDSQRIADAQRALDVAKEGVSAFREDVATEQKLYDRTAERFRITREQANLAASESFQRLSQDGSESPLYDTIQRRGSVNQAEHEASLARQRVETLRAQIGLLESRQERVRTEADQINQWLDEGRQLDRQQRQDLTQERQRLVDEERSLEDRMSRHQGQLVLAETTLRIKEETAAQELADYRSWQRQLVISLGLLTITIAVLLLLRFLVARYVTDPDRRYALNRSLSLAVTLVLFIGLAIIFLRQFPHLITGIGVVLAGVAIALQEVILSFFGFFAIRGLEVTGSEIGFASATLRRGRRHQPPGHHSGRGDTHRVLQPPRRTKTGALTWINNNAIFREKMTNYTRGFPLHLEHPDLHHYLRKQLATREADPATCHNHDEILTTAKLARKRSPRRPRTSPSRSTTRPPRIRTWTADSGVELRVRFMVHPRRRRALIDTINREVMAAIADAPDIDFAYNTLRVIPTQAESAT